jgi:PAS domain S-box-containing protein
VLLWALPHSLGIRQPFTETGEDLWWEMDPIGVLAFVAPNVEDHPGYAPDELVGRRTAEILLPPDRDRA